MTKFRPKRGLFFAEDSFQNMTQEANPKLEIANDPDDDSCATFSFYEEGHTLGNSLHYVLMKNPAVSFSGYSVPHPSEPKMNLRIQTAGTITAVDALRQGLTDLKAISEHILTTFDNEVPVNGKRKSKNKEK